MIAKNNIFNIRTGAKWKGMTGAKNGFVEFETREHGIRAWIVLMHNYRVKHRCATVRAIITRFAPPSENQTQRHRARHHYALCAAQREPDAGVHQVLQGACVQVGDYMAHNHRGLCALGLCHGENGDEHRAHRAGDLRRDAQV